ncbi:MAG: aminoacyl-tRNA hydrolase [Desulfobulbus propionicus]|nr:MAG: aminoacyl-tRNA hydrolase [Desulfobulbus propionicus]
MVNSLYAFIGLGNPGAKYHLTRHNVGFMLLDYLAGQCSCAVNREKFEGVYGRGKAFGKQVLFVKPMTYMNNSGGCVRRFTDYFAVPTENLFVIHDDIDMETGRVKVVTNKGAGGHNGVRSLSRHLNTKQFSRLKMGVGRPAGEEALSVDKYVLSRFPAREHEIIRDRFALVEQAAELFVRQGVEHSMNVINGWNTSPA